MSKRSTNKTKNEGDSESKSSLEDCQILLSPNCSNYEDYSPNDSVNDLDFDLGDDENVENYSSTSLDEELYGTNDTFITNLNVIKEKLGKLNINLSLQSLSLTSSPELSCGDRDDDVNGYITSTETTIDLTDCLTPLHISNVDYGESHYHSMFPPIDECPELEYTEMTESLVSYRVPEKKLCLRAPSPSLENFTKSCKSSIELEDTEKDVEPSTTASISYAPPEHIKIPIPAACFDGRKLPPFLRSQGVQCSQGPESLNNVTSDCSFFELGLNLPSSIEDGGDSSSPNEATPVETRIIILEKIEKQPSFRSSNKVSPISCKSSTCVSEKQYDASPTSCLSSKNSNYSHKTAKSPFRRRPKQIYTDSRENLFVAPSAKQRKKCVGLDVPRIVETTYTFPAITNITTSPQNYAHLMCKGDFDFVNYETKNPENLFSQVQVHSCYKDRATMLINSPTLSPTRRVYEIKHIQHGDSVTISKSRSLNDKMQKCTTARNNNRASLRKAQTTDMAYYAVSSDDDSEKVESFNEMKQNDDARWENWCCCFLFYKLKLWNVNRGEV